MGKMACFWSTVLLTALVYYSETARAQSQGDIRLVNSTSGSTGGSGGRVDILINGLWGTICDDNFGQAEADIVCQQLGYTSAADFGNSNTQKFRSPDVPQQIWLDEVDCPFLISGGNVLADCSYNTFGDHDCSHVEDVTVQCSLADFGALRLAQGSSTSSSFSEGRLEVFLDGQWGTICDDNFGSSEGSVACQQLGFDSATAYGNNLGFDSGSSSQPMWLNQVNCDPFDSRIIDCSHNTLGTHDCSHREDIMIQCSFPTATTDFDELPSRGDLRLVQGSNTSSSFSEGRLEIFLNGQWGTVCDDGFTFLDAHIACQQLGYAAVVQYRNNLGFGSGSSFQPIWLDDVRCSPLDTRLIDCSHSGVGVDICGHNEDVQINCGTTIVPTFSPILIDGDLRLVQRSDTSSSFSKGRLEIVFDEKWGTICNDFFGLNEANVACRQLGYSSATQFGGNLGFGFGSSSQRIWLDNVICTSSESRIVDCSHNTIGNNNCNHFQAVMISCIGNGDLRLAQGSRSFSSFTAGRLEVYLNGEWGTICDDGFFSTEADVACRQLGYTEALQYGNNLGFGSGSSVQEIWLDNVGCTAFDTRIIDCFHNGIGDHDCTHSEDVMVNCGSTVLPTLVFTTSSTFPESSSNVVGIIVGSVVGGTVLIIIVVVACIFACVCCGVCAASSATSARRTALPPAVGYSANTATVTTVTPSQQQRANTAAAFAASAQQPPPATNYYASQPVKGYGIDLNTQNQQAHFTSQQAPPPYNAAMQYPAVKQQQQAYPPPPAYPTMEQQRQPNPTEELPYYPQEQAYPPDQQQYPPPPNQAPYTTDQLQAAAPYPVAGDPAYPPAAVGYPVQGYHPQQN